jgi:hypothetical protein
MCPSLSGFTSGFNTMLLQQIAIAKNVGLITEVKLHFLGLHDNLTFLLAPEDLKLERKCRVEFRLFK